jgi:hypothetical protein
MNRRLVASLVVAGGLFLSSSVLRAEVKTEEKNQFKMEGMMGRMMGMFGGKAAREGVINTVAVKGNRKVTTSENTSEIIDLGEQKIYQLDLKKKNYTVMTFDEMRRQMKEQQEKAMKAAKEEKKEDPSQKQMEFDFSLKETGQKRTISGYDCREVLMTITGHEKGKTLEESGGMVIASHIWLGPDIPATREIADFDMRYAKAMEQILGMGSAEQMAMAMAMYPGMKEMMGKMQGESVNMKGAQILTEMTMESVMNAAQAQSAQEQKQDSDSGGSLTSVRGLGGMLGGLRKKKPAETDNANAAKPKNRSTIMTVTHELLKVETAVPDSYMAIPADFKKK